MDNTTRAAARTLPPAPHARVVLSISGDRPCTVRIRNFFDAKFVRQKPSLLIAYGTLSDDSRIIVLLEVTGPEKYLNGIFRT